MRRILLTLMLLAWAMPASAQFTLVASDEESAGPTTSHTFTGGVAASAGDLVVLHAVGRNGGTFTSASDATNGSYTCPAGTNIAAGSASAALCYFINSAAATLTPSLVMASDTWYVRVELWRPTGAGGSVAVEASSENSNSAQTTHVGTTVNTGANTQLVVATAGINATTACTSTSGMTVSNLTRGCFMYDITSVSSTTHDAAFTTGASQNTAVVIIAFNDPTSGATCTSGLPLLGVGKCD